MNLEELQKLYNKKPFYCSLEALKIVLPLEKPKKPKSYFELLKVAVNTDKPIKDKCKCENQHIESLSEKYYAVVCTQCGKTLKISMRCKT